MSYARPYDGAVPEFELRSAAYEAAVPWETFRELPTREQAGYVAHRRARSWIAALDAWEQRKK